MSDSLWPHGLQHARPPCPSPSPGVYSDSCPLSRWCHPTISSYVVPFSSCPQSFPASCLFKWVSSSHQVADVLEFQLQHQSFQWTLRTDCFRMDWLDLLSVQGTLKSLLQHHSSKASILQHLAFFIVQLSHSYITIGKTIALTRWTFVGKVMSLLFNMLFRLVITFLLRSIFLFHGYSHHLQWFSFTEFIQRVSVNYLHCSIRPLFILKASNNLPSNYWFPTPSFKKKMDFKKYGPFFEVYKLRVTVSACDIPVINLCPKQ